MGIFTFDHIHIFASDVAATKAWFIDLFGAEDAGTNATGMPRLRLGGTTFLLRGERPGEGLTATAEKRHFGTAHIGFRVEDLDAVYAELEAKGVRFEQPPLQAAPGLKITFLRGPDDVRLELLQF